MFSLVSWPWCPEVQIETSATPPLVLFLPKEETKEKVRDCYYIKHYQNRLVTLRDVSAFTKVMGWITNPGQSDRATLSTMSLRLDPVYDVMFCQFFFFHCPNLLPDLVFAVTKLWAVLEKWQPSQVLYVFQIVNFCCFRYQARSFK